MEIKTRLRAEIQDEFDKLKTMEVGSEEYKVTVDGIGKLIDRAIELDKSEVEAEVHKNENELKAKQAQEDVKHRWISHLINFAGIAIPTFLTIWGTKTSLKFEETGTVTTMAGRNFLANLFRRK